MAVEAEAGRLDTPIALGDGRPLGERAWGESDLRGLGLDYYGLQKQAEAAAQPQSSSPTFVELTPTAMVGKQCHFELDNGAGAVMRVQLVGTGRVRTLGG